MIFVNKFLDKKGRDIQVFRLLEDSYNLVKKFYDDNISSLENKAFFLPYTDQELAEVVSYNKGYFLGAFHQGKLVGVSGLDFDAEYGEGIRRASQGNITLKLGLNLYEYSGLMVDSEYRRAGIIEELYTAILSYAKTTLGQCFICSVADVSNINSLSNLMKRGFSMVYLTEQNGIFRSVYNVLPVNHIDDSLAITPQEYRCNNMQEFAEKLQDNYIGVGVEKTDNDMVYILRKRHMN